MVNMVGCNATPYNISVMSWLSVLLMEETGVPREQLLTFHKLLTIDHIVLYK
jgi:hypothetical protein